MCNANAIALLNGTFFRRLYSWCLTSGGSTFPSISLATNCWLAFMFMVQRFLSLALYKGRNGTELDLKFICTFVDLDLAVSCRPSSLNGIEPVCCNLDRGMLLM